MRPMSKKKNWQQRHARQNQSSKNREEKKMTFPPTPQLTTPWYSAETRKPPKSYRAVEGKVIGMLNKFLKFYEPHISLL